MIDMWTGPTPTPQQFPANQPNGILKLLDKIKALELQIKESTSNLLGAAGIKITRDGMTINSDLTLAGTLTAAGFITDVELADGAVTASKLGAGSVTYAAMANPVAPGVVYGTASNFALSATMATLLTATITVPPGFTQCVVSMSSRVTATNGNTTGGADGAGADYIYTRTNIAGIFPDALPILVDGSGHSAVSVDPYAQLLPGLTPGGTFNITVEAKTGYAAWAANTVNVADLSGSLQWFQ